MLYTYQCQVCGYEIEKSHSIKREPYKYLFCARCRRGVPVKRLIGGRTAFILKGSGWAKDGYHKGS